MHIIATAGHVDHGKSTLVRTLTGVDPDRLAEEKRRGLTIDLGFAFTSLPSGRQVSFIDVPGHVRFIKNMLAGVGAIDAVVFVVAATEGWMPQSTEHLAILDLLGTSAGIVVLTKRDLVDTETLELAALDTAEHVADTFLADAPVVAVDALGGTGIGELRVALDELTATAATAADTSRPRLWIDRSFAAPGAGRVVTGTLAGGTIATDDRLSLVPGAGAVRVRAIQTQGGAVDSIGPGHRVALNLTGAPKELLRRGVAVVRGDQWHRTGCFDASLNVLAQLDHAVSRRGAYALHLGTGEWPVRLRVLGPDALAPGEIGNVRLFVDTELPLLSGDRYVLREFGRDETVGGGMVLDVDPQLRASHAQPDLSVDRVIAEHGWLEVAQLERLTGHVREPTLGQWVGTPDALEQLLGDVRTRVSDAGGLGLDLAQLTELERLAVDRLTLDATEGLSVVDGRVRAGADVDPLAEHPLLGRLNATPFSPPVPDGVSSSELTALVRRGLIVNADGLFFSAQAVEQAAGLLAELLAAQPDGVTLAQIRDQLGTTRKYALALAGHFDRTGITRRRGDYRIAGPRLATSG